MTRGARRGRWTLRRRFDDRLSGAREATARWLSNIVHSLAFAEDHGSWFYNRIDDDDLSPAAAFVADQPGESGSVLTAAAGAVLSSEATAPAFLPRPAMQHVSWGRDDA